MAVSLSEQRYSSMPTAASMFVHEARIMATPMLGPSQRYCQSQV